MKAIIGITLGDPAGVGPEIVARALAGPNRPADRSFAVYGDTGVLRLAARACGISLDVVEIEDPGQAPDRGIGVLAGPEPLRDHAFGEPRAEHVPAVLSWIERAARDAIEGRIGALVTAPINKGLIAAHTGKMEGHTEMLARLTGAGNPVMLMRGPSLSCVPLTTHIPLSEVPAALSVDLVVSKIGVLADGLIRYFGLPSPRIALAGLNPHAGEGGALGNEEATILDPAARALREAGRDLSGPVSADAVFREAVKGRYDAVVCCYHDQALIPFKLLHFADGVNVTLGLPIVRTSPDHGTAYDIAGRGIADARSMEAAVATAVEMVQNAGRTGI